MMSKPERFRALRSGRRPHARSGGYAAGSIARYARTQTSRHGGPRVVVLSVLCLLVLPAVAAAQDLVIR